MCIGCYEDAGSPAIINEKTKKAAELIQAIYSHEYGCVGGTAHIVVDDWNLSDEDIDWCIEHSKTDDYYCKELVKLCVDCLIYLKTLTLDERHSTMAISNGIINVKQ